jgi:hypothetical protein
MIWLTWRQFRSQAVVAAAALVAVAVTLAVTGPQLASLYRSSGLAACRATCPVQASNFFGSVKGSSTELIFYIGIFLLYATPALIGIFWGAPLVSRELEAGTFRLAWNQSVTRNRWLAIKLALVGLAAIAAAGLLSLMISMWSGPLYQAAQKAGGPNGLSVSRFAPPLFGANGIAPIGYAAFAFGLGVTAGVLVRRTLPAMAITLAAFAAAQLLMIGAVRPHLIPASTATVPLSAATFNGMGEANNGHLILDLGTVNSMPSAWIVAARPVDSAGQPATTVPLPCASMTNTWLQCLGSHGIRIQVSYQPASRYWALQWLETAIYLVLAAGLGGLCVWQVRRKRS